MYLSFTYLFYVFVEKIQYTKYKNTLKWATVTQVISTELVWGCQNVMTFLWFYIRLSPLFDF